MGMARDGWYRCGDIGRNTADEDEVLNGDEEEEGGRTRRT